MKSGCIESGLHTRMRLRGIPVIVLFGILTLELRSKESVQSIHPLNSAFPYDLSYTLSMTARQLTEDVCLFFRRQGVQDPSESFEDTALVCVAAAQ